jgi:hypothetical protein
MDSDIRRTAAQHAEICNAESRVTGTAGADVFEGLPSCSPSCLYAAPDKKLLSQRRKAMITPNYKMPPRIFYHITY